MAGQSFVLANATLDSMVKINRYRAQQFITDRKAYVCYLTVLVTHILRKIETIR